MPKLSKDDLLGKSESQVAAMGAENWSKYCLVHRSKMTAESLAHLDDGEIVYARCAFDRNVRLLRQLPRRRRAAVIAMREHAWLLMLACIVMQNELDGGGTSQVHLPRLARVDLEDATLAIIAGGRSEPWIPVTAYLKDAYSTLGELANPKSRSNRSPGFGRGSERELMAAHRALHHLNGISRFLKHASERERDLIVGCLEGYTYFGNYEPWDRRSPRVKKRIGQ